MITRHYVESIRGEVYGIHGVIFTQRVKQTGKRWSRRKQSGSQITGLGIEPEGRIFLCCLWYFPVNLKFPLRLVGNTPRTCIGVSYYSVRTL
jgi:hypothetical protein